MTAPLTELNGLDHTILGGRAATPEARAASLTALDQVWDAGTRPKLLETLARFAAEGTRKSYNDACRADVAVHATLEPWETIEKVITDPKALAPIYFSRAHRERIGPRGLVAWDAVRLVTVAGWGAVAGLISEDEAWSYILPMAQLVQHIYSSWDELGKHYLLGFEFAYDHWDGQRARGHLSLMSKPESPWRALPWRADLGAHGLQVPLQRIVFEPPPPPQPLLKKQRAPGSGAPDPDFAAANPGGSSGIPAGIRIAGSVVLVVVIAVAALVSSGVIPLFGNDTTPTTSPATPPKAAVPARPTAPPKKR